MEKCGVDKNLRGMLNLLVQKCNPHFILYHSDFTCTVMWPRLQTTAPEKQT